MNYIVSAIAAIYGVLNVIAAIMGIKNSKNGDTAAIMIIGGGALISAAGLSIMGYAFDWVTALSGCLLISIAAFMNGKRGEFHAGHHVVRAVIETVLVIGFILF